MTIEHYINGFDSILNATEPKQPYNNPDYLEYTKLNFSRFKRWQKHISILPVLSNLLRELKTPQKWVVITEHWCGDAAHIVPIFAALAEFNPLISVEIQLRDENSEIDHYLTNGGKAIPVLIVRDENNVDLFHWGPRPAPCQQLMNELKAKEASFEEIKIALQNWYNADKTITTQTELLAHFKTAFE